MNQALLYSKYNNLQRADAEYVMDKYFRLIQWRDDGTERVLDIGCGAGDITTKILMPRLPSSFANLVGVDKSPDMVEYSRKKWCAAPINNGRVTFQHLDIVADEMCPEWVLAFDHIVSFYCLHWTSDPRKALYNICMMLKPGGDVLLTMLASNSTFHVYENLARNNKWTSYMVDLHKYKSPLQYSAEQETEFECILRDTGFNVHVCKVFEHQYEYPDLSIFSKSMEAVNPFVRNIPENLRNEYMSDFVEEARNLKYINIHTKNEEEKVSVSYRVLVALAIKPL